MGVECAERRHAIAPAMSAPDLGSGSEYEEILGYINERITPHLKLTMRAVGPPACCYSPLSTRAGRTSASPLCTP